MDGGEEARNSGAFERHQPGVRTLDVLCGPEPGIARRRYFLAESGRKRPGYGLPRRDVLGSGNQEGRIVNQREQSGGRDSNRLIVSTVFVIIVH